MSERFAFVGQTLIAATILGASSLHGQTLTHRVGEKIAPELARAFAASRGGPVEMLVVLADQADLRDVVDGAGGRRRGRQVVERLTAAARRSQGSLLDALARSGAPQRAFWIANFVWTRGGPELARRLAARADVARVDLNPSLRLPEPWPGAASESVEAPLGVEANLTQVGAPAVWALGYLGQGVVIGGQDTGYQWDHPAVQPHYRGWNGGGAVHDYNWHDAIHSGGGACGADAVAPCDDHGHGTHTMGIQVGDDGDTNQIGMAPGARWIGCRNMDQGNGTPATYSECFQWFVAPTDLSDANPDPDQAPDVINNSWSCPVSEGCTTPAILQTVVENTRAAGIVVVSSAGNEGSACSTISAPVAIYEATFTVGAVDATDSPASFSSRGPVTVDGSNRLKPDIVAPGVAIRSSVPAGAYAALSGTSMAAPHVAGLVALLLSADPTLAADADAIEALIRQSAVEPGTSQQLCGGVAADQFPNNTFGAGRIDALAAAEQLLANGLIFRDGFDWRGAARWSATVP